jgi:hypothetical protein
MPIGGTAPAAEDTAVGPRGDLCGLTGGGNLTGMLIGVCDGSEGTGTGAFCGLVIGDGTDELLIVVGIATETDNGMP